MTLSRNPFQAPYQTFHTKKRRNLLKSTILDSTEKDINLEFMIHQMLGDKRNLMWNRTHLYLELNQYNMKKTFQILLSKVHLKAKSIEMKEDWRILATVSQIWWKSENLLMKRWRILKENKKWNKKIEIMQRAVNIKIRFH